MSAKNWKGEKPMKGETSRQKRRQPEASQPEASQPEAVPAPATERWRDADELRWAARRWAARMGVRTPAIHIRPMTTKWGSLSRTITHTNSGHMGATTTTIPYAGRLTLNSELLTLPRDLGEFVIVHELVHLLAPNHGRVFKSFLHAYLPDWRDRERRLRGMSEW
jgi:predicted metal-dependent hydrolase